MKVGKGKRQGALMFIPPAFGPSDNSTRTFQSMDTGSQKHLVLMTHVSQSGPTVRPPQTHSLGSRKVGPTVRPYHLVPL
jgi:hypothetical protein